MTRILPSSGEEAWRLRRVQTILVEDQPSSEEIVRRLHRRGSRAQQRSSLKRAFAPVAWGILLGGLSCGTAFAWAIHTGRVHIGTTSAKVDEPQARSVDTVKQRRLAKQRRDLEQPHQAEARREVVQGETTLQVSNKQKNAITVDAMKQDPTRRSDGATTSLTKRLAEKNSASLPQSAQLRQHTHQKSSASHPASTEQQSDATNSLPRLSETDRIWMQVSELLRAGRYDAAEQALTPLLAAGDVRAQQASLLLRLQLRVHARASVSEQERQELQHLADNGLTSSIRRSAQRLLHQIRR